MFRIAIASALALAASFSSDDAFSSQTADAALSESPIVETVATHAKGIPELFDTLMAVGS